LPTGVVGWGLSFVRNEVLEEITESIKKLQLKRQYTSAIDLATQIRDVYAQTQEQTNLAKILNILATLYRKIQQHEKAIVYAQKALSIAKEKEIRDVQLEAENLIAIITAKRKKLSAEKIAHEKEALNAKLSEEKRKGEE
jgi:tetratricopeptide (TPR) repeat protein